MPYEVVLMHVPCSCVANSDPSMTIHLLPCHRHSPTQTLHALCVLCRWILLLSGVTWKGKVLASWECASCLTLNFISAGFRVLGLKLYYIL